MAITTPVNGSERTSEADEIGRLRAELGGYLREMQTWHREDPDYVLMKLSAYGARFAELRNFLVRNETRLALAFRTKELEPFMDQLEFQFKVHSRAQAIREFDLKLGGGAPA